MACRFSCKLHENTRGFLRQKLMLNAWRCLAECMLMQWVMAYVREQVPPNPCSRFIKLLVLTTSAMIFPRYTQIVFQPHVKMPHLHCCDAALHLKQQHNLPVCCFWLAHSETHWWGRFFFKNTKTNNRFDLGKKKTPAGDKQQRS